MTEIGVPSQQWGRKGDTGLYVWHVEYCHYTNKYTWVCSLMPVPFFKPKTAMKICSPIFSQTQFYAREPMNQEASVCAPCVL